MKFGALVACDIRVTNSFSSYCSPVNALAVSYWNEIRIEGV